MSICVYVCVLIFLFWLIKNALLKLDEFSSRAQKSRVLKTPTLSTKCLLNLDYSFATTSFHIAFLAIYIIIICIYICFCFFTFFLILNSLLINSTQRVENLNRVKHCVLNKTNKISFPLKEYYTRAVLFFLSTSMIEKKYNDYTRVRYIIISLKNFKILSHLYAWYLQIYFNKTEFKKIQLIYSLRKKN